MISRILAPSPKPWNSSFETEPSSNGQKANTTKPGRQPTDDEVITIAGNSDNGAKFRKLFDGDTTDYGSDDSRADAALIACLSFWTRDPEQIERIARRSKLVRPKWDDPRPGGTWIQGTIRNALEKYTECYKWPKAGSNGEKPKKKSRKKTLVKQLADEICRHNHFAQDAGGKLYRYLDGVYRARGEQYVRAQVKRWCLAWKMEDAWSTHLAKETVEFLRVDAPELWERPPIDVLDVKNGLLRVKDRELLPHSPDHLSTVQLPAEYVPDAACPSNKHFVEQTFPADARALAWEIIAWLMLPDTSIQKAILLTGEGANGKSVWLNLVRTFLGKPNTAALSLHKLESDRFASARLIGKLANICPDLPSEHLAGTSTFKALTGGDELPAEYKFCDSFDFSPFARLVFSANHPPRSADGSHAFFRRWLVIPFERTFEPHEQIPRDMLDGLLITPEEFSGVLNMALDALDGLRERRRFTEPESCKRAWEDFHATTDPLAVWLHQNTVDDPAAIVAKGTLRTAYNTHAAEEGRPTLGNRAFGVALRRLRPGLEDAQRTVNGKFQWVYVGFGLRGDQYTQ